MSKLTWITAKYLDRRFIESAPQILSDSAVLLDGRIPVSLQYGGGIVGTDLKSAERR